MDRLGMALARARRRPRSVGVLFIDLDRFKEVNDRFGHDAGDRLLVAVGSRLVRAVRLGDTVGRIGGDEFVVVCEELVRGADAVDVAKRVLTSLGSPVSIGVTSVTTLASIGIVIASDGELEAHALLHLADLAMYRAKAKGGSGYHLRDDGPIAERGDRTQSS
jgi:diguanylate cyclase (GGDEF)-like protein